MRFALVLSEAGSGLRRNLSMVISVVLVTFISLTFVGTAILMQMQIGQMKTYWYDRAQVAVYMCTETDVSSTCQGQDASAEQIAAVKAKLASPALAPFIDKFYFEDHQQAYADFKKQFKGNPVADYVTPELLNQTFWIKLKDQQQSDVIAQSLSGVAGVQSVTDQRSYLDQIFRILNAASLTAIAIAAVMLVAAALLIATTIRLSAFSRRRELGIMRLVGASNGFIQTPFVLEGMLAALIGSLLSVGAVFAIVQFFVRGYLAQKMQLTSFVGLDSAWIVAPILVIVGIGLAALASNVAITRYLKV
ncbi:ABC transporter permease [Planctomonas sp. JC2975]|uniref:permease-like cell division protein FtsX n=1 Tax=Planctomonas sp. JC2975 TaxID=2729626 RepID=UPI00147323E9|nr:permease-like cell division protein FtsX [Planctomonas sp. JC2975]NNC11108.1 ABC transporter permease [Planctomonas sp. JC2975]